MITYHLSVILLYSIHFLMILGEVLCQYPSLDQSLDSHEIIIIHTVGVFDYYNRFDCYYNFIVNK
jgi:hypothetical protein